MKRWIRQSSDMDVNERISIDFYPDLDVLEDDITAAKRKKTRSSNIRRVFKDKAQNVIRDITNYLHSKKVKILNVEASSVEGSDSTYYDVDISVLTNKGPKYLFFRIADHEEHPDDSGSRIDYLRRKAKNYESRELTTAELDTIFEYCNIAVTGIQFTTYDKALNSVKNQIDERLRFYGIDI